MENNSQNTQNNKPMFSGIVLTPPSKVLYKNNEGKSEYVIYNVEITQEGPMKGKVITGAFTIKNATGETKQAPNKGDEVSVYADVVQGKPLFEIGGARVETSSDEEILQALAMASAGQTV